MWCRRKWDWVASLSGGKHAADWNITTLCHVAAALCCCDEKEFDTLQVENLPDLLSFSAKRKKVSNRTFKRQSIKYFLFFLLPSLLLSYTNFTSLSILSSAHEGTLKTSQHKLLIPPRLASSPTREREKNPKSQLPLMISEAPEKCLKVIHSREQRVGDEKWNLWRKKYIFTTPADEIWKWNFWQKKKQTTWISFY